MTDKTMREALEVAHQCVEHDSTAADIRLLAEQFIALAQREAQESVDVVAYLDIGAGGYLDIGSDLSDEQLLALPKGRHALKIAGTYGVDGYTAAPSREVPEGWKLVPVQPTKAMWDAWDSAPFSEDDQVERNNAWALMLTAAPKPEQQEAPAERECRHCGFLCRPNPAESRKWYPLEQANHPVIPESSTEQQEAPEQKAPLAAIEFALRQGMECHDFLRLWNEGEFDIIRQEWPECPDAVFIGADPLFAADRARRKHESMYSLPPRSAR